MTDEPVPEVRLQSVDDSSNRVLLFLFSFYGSW